MSFDYLLLQTNLLYSSTVQRPICSGILHVVIVVYHLSFLSVVEPLLNNSPLMTTFCLRYAFEVIKVEVRAHHYSINFFHDDQAKVLSIP